MTSLSLSTLTILGSIFPSQLLRWVLGNKVSFFDGLQFILKHLSWSCMSNVLFTFALVVSV